MGVAIDIDVREELGPDRLRRLGQLSERLNSPVQGILGNRKLSRQADLTDRLNGRFPESFPQKSPFFPKKCFIRC